MHHRNLVLKSGVNANGGASRVHLTITETLGCAIQYDQLDVAVLASTEMLYRRLVQSESGTPQPTRAGLLGVGHRDGHQDRRRKGER